MMETRVCLSPTCPLAGVPQPLENFGPCKKGRGGRRSWCRVCESRRHKEKYEVRRWENKSEKILRFRDTGEVFQLTGQAVTPPNGGCMVVYGKGTTTVCPHYQACEASAAYGGPVRCEEVAVEMRGEEILIW